MNKEFDMPPAECPPESELSAWVDGEAVGDFGGHIEKCSNCRARVDFYTSINSLLRLVEPPSPDLADRIHARCLKEASSRRILPAVVSFENPYFKVAAVLVAVAALAVGIHSVIPGVQTVSREQNEELNAVTPADGLSADNVAGNPSLRLSPSYAGDSADPGNFLRLVAANGRGEMDFDTATRRTRPRMLPQAVRHVWVVDDLPAAQQQFEAAVPEGSASLCSSSTDRVLCYRVVLTDQEVQALVDRLEGLGWALISPALPQPGEDDRLHLTDRQITYVAEIVAE